jgi:hypothetical protein
MNHLWVIIVAGHVWGQYGTQFFHDKSQPGFDHAACVAKAAEVGGACTKVRDEPPLNTPEHLQWENDYCAPGMYIPQGDMSGRGCPPLMPRPSPPPAQP